MIKVENSETWGFEHAIRGMRNPMNSWDKSDSVECDEELRCDQCNYYSDCCSAPEYWVGNKLLVIGHNDLTLMKKLYSAGPEHRKYLRQIFVSMDITAPLYWWKEFDTYKVGTVANSCSTMHKIAAKKFSLEDFSIEHLYSDERNFFEEIVEMLNGARELYLSEKEGSRKKSDWWQMIQLLPSSYNQRRTVTMNYENVISMIHQRTGHKLDEWNVFVDILKDLPYIKEITAEVCV